MFRCAADTAEHSLLSLPTKLTLALMALALVSGCSRAATETARPSPTPTALLPQAASGTPAPSATLAPSASAAPSPEPPSRFDSDLLRNNVQAETYLSDTCQYLAYRWDPERSLPGTVVAPIMFHSIVPTGDTPSDAAHIDYATFEAIIALADSLGFETITSEELLGFLLENQAIPPRAMILILDDRRPGTAEDFFLPVNEAKGWTTTLAWPIGDTDSRAGLWDWIERVVASGYFDVQSHGLLHLYLQEGMPEDEVREEVGGSIPILEEHFGQAPIVYVWPGGNYTGLGIEVAREVGFELGFTVHSRGPLAFNWIPQGEEEHAYGDALMLLPRFWSSAALLNLQQTADIGDAAQAFARANYPSEAAWYQANCGGELPSLDEVFGEP